MTKRLFLTFTLLYFFFTASHLFAQVKFGVKGGLNLTKGGFEDLDDTKTQFALRLHAGAFVRIAFNEKLYLKPELLYAQKGWKASADALNPEGVSVTINYINVPVLLGYNVHERISIFGGPEMGFKLSAKRKPNTSSWVDVFEKFDVGIAAGSSFSISENLGIDLRYIHGFKGLYKFEGRDANNMPTGEVTRVGRNQAIELGVFYIF